MTLWWQRGVVYQIYPRSYADSNGDGVGDLAGVMEKLDYLQWLGIDAIWFSPIFPSPMKDFGYDVADYENIHHEYGTLEQFDALLHAAHERGIKIILDLVPNHSSSQHPWFLESRSSRDNPKRDWYIWRDPAPDGGPPNNWLAYFGGRAWTFDEVTGQYYLHNFLPEQPDFNWRNPEVMDAIFGVIRFWLGRGVDGFRIDVIDRILKHPEFLDNPLNPAWKEGDNPVWSLLRVYSEQQPEVHDYMREFRKVFDEFPEKVAIGEVDYGLSSEKLAAFYGAPTADGQGDELHLPFNFNLIAIPWNAEQIRRHVESYESALPSYATPNYVLGNHDMARIASRVGAAQARVAAMLLLTLRGAPTLYYGDELGMQNVPIPPAKMQDPQGINTPGFNRDEARTPMQWNSTPNAGFCSPNIEPWLPVAEDYQAVNVTAQRDDPASMLTFHRTLLHTRRETPALHIGSLKTVDVPEGCFAYQREHEGQRLLIVLNFTDQPYTFTGTGAGQVILSTYPDRAGRAVDLANLELLPDEGVIIELNG